MRARGAPCHAAPVDGSGAVALAEVLGAVAVAGGLSMGQPAEHGVRSAVLADRLAVAAGVGSRTTADAVAASLLRWSGCTANAAEFAALLGNDVDGRAALQVRGPAVLAAGQVARLGVEGPALARAHCEVAQRIAGRLGVGAGVVEALGQVFEQWNGQGVPAGLAGPALTPQTRLMTLAGDLEMTARLLGPAAARRQLWERSGRVYDPELALVADGVLPDLLEELDAVDPWDLLAATALGRRIGLQAVPVEAALTALADFADLKLPWTAGFSRSAARIAARAAAATGGGRTTTSSPARSWCTASAASRSPTRSGS